MHQYVKRAAFLIYCFVDGLVYVDAIVLLKMTRRESLNAIPERLSFFSTPAEICSAIYTASLFRDYFIVFEVYTADPH